MVMEYLQIQGCMLLCMNLSLISISISEVVPTVIPAGLMNDVKLCVDPVDIE